MTPRLAPLSDEQRARVRERLARTGRAQINDVLEKVDAQALHAAAATSEYNIVTRRGTGHVDLPAAWLASLQPHKNRRSGRRYRRRRARTFSTYTTITPSMTWRRPAGRRRYGAIFCPS